MAVAPDWLTWAFWARDPQSIRDLVLTVGAVAGFGLLLWRTWNVHRQAGAGLRQAETAARRHEAQVEADRERRLTDNFTRAVDQLGSDKLATRLGAIYALERISNESPTDHWPIMETLIAYIRDRAPWTLEKAEQDEKVWRELRPATDVQAVLTVIGRRRREQEAEDQRLDLRETDLRGVDLSHGHFADAELEQGHLEGATLFGVHLEDANLRKAHLNRAVLFGAHLEGAWLVEAYLEDANLSRAHLQGGNLSSAHLRGARLAEAHLEGADLTNSDMTQQQLDEAFIDENTKLPSHLTSTKVSAFVLD